MGIRVAACELFRVLPNPILANGPARSPIQKTARFIAPACLLTIADACISADTCWFHCSGRRRSGQDTVAWSQRIAGWCLPSGQRNWLKGAALLPANTFGFHLAMLH